MINRRQILCGGLLLPMAGCGHRDTRRCELAYANLTGDWISGLVKIGDRFRDSMASLPLGAPGVDAPTSVIQGQTCQFRGVYGMTGENIQGNCAIRSCPPTISHPYCRIEIRRNGILKAEWFDRQLPFSADDYAVRCFRHADLRMAVGISPPNSWFTSFGLRQRPEILGDYVLKNFRDTNSRNIRQTPCWMLRTSLSPLMILGFANEPPDGDYDCWRIPLDFNSPELVHLRDHHLWIEPQVDGTVRLGRFSTDATSTKELTDRFVAKQLPQATDFVTLKAQRTKRYPMPHYPDDFISYMLDLRFDDER